MIFPLFWMIILSLKKYPKSFNDLNYIEKVDWLREEIEKVQKETHNLSNCGTPISGLLAWNFIYQHLCEARFWLGFELGRIKGNGTI